MRRHGIHPSKRLGQNFLCDPNTLDRIVQTANLSAIDHVLEIGPGLGALTIRLARCAREVFCVEIDHGLVRVLSETLAEGSNVRVIEGDFLQECTAELIRGSWESAQGVVVANIPYSITTPILELLIQHRTCWRRAVLLVQAEVADRLKAEPGSKAYGSLSLFAQYFLQVSVAMKVSRTVFMPRPDVDSAVLVLEPKTETPLSAGEEQTLFLLTRAAFGQRRKTLRNALGNAGHWPAEQLEQGFETAELDPGLRGEALTLDQFCSLARALSPPGGGG